MEASSEEIKGMIKLQAQLQQAHQVMWALHWNMKGKRFLSDHPWLDGVLFARLLKCGAWYGAVMVDGIAWLDGGMVEMWLW